MSWVIVALVAYFLNAIVALLDKVLLAGRIQAPAVYAFFVALFSLFSFMFAPFGFEYLGWWATGIFLLSGVLFLLYLLFLYMAVQKSELSRIAPLVGTVASLVALIASFFGLASGETATFQSGLALIFLIGGGLLLAFDLPLRKNDRISLYVLYAGVAWGASLLFLKYGYAESDFVSGLVWSRLGIFLGGLALLFVPLYRMQILEKLTHFKRPNHRGATTSAIFIINKSCSGIAAFLIVYAATLGPISFIQALSGFQYLFLLLMVMPLAHRFPRIFQEKLSWSDWFQKGAAIALIGVGLWLGGLSGIAWQA